jgi:plastocyanin
VNVAPNQEVRWVNGSSEVMELDLSNPPSELVPPTLGLGEEFPFAFEGPGTYAYQCTFSSSGVKQIATVTVEGQ